MTVQAIPAGHHTVTPYLTIKHGAKALEFYKKAFGATETFKLMMPDGRLPDLNDLPRLNIRFGLVKEVHRKILAGI